MAEQISKIEQKHYAFEEAVKRAAEQNVARDFRKGKASHATLGELSLTDRVLQYHLARKTLMQDGQNTLPEYPDTEHVCVK